MASLFNLIILCQDTTRAAQLHELVGMIIEKFPCRILFIEGNLTNKEDYLKTTVTTKTVGKGSTAITCDEINIEVTGKELARVPFVILPYLMPDLPVHLLWGQDPTTDDAILPHLKRFSTRIIFDSETTDNLQSFASKMVEKIKHSESEVVDMNWARLSSWRAILAQVFETPEAQQELRECKKLTITYNLHPTSFFQHNAIQAIYLQGWLAAQLDWKFEKIDKQPSKTIITYSHSKGTVTVDLVSKDIPKLSPGSLSSVEMTTYGDYHYSLHRTEGTRLVKIQTSSPAKCELPYSLPLSNQEKDVQFLCEVFFQPTSSHYSHMLESIAKLKIDQY